MAGRRTNLALLLLLFGAFVSGGLAYAIGTNDVNAVVVAMHAGIGLGLLVLVPWKSVIARRGLRRDRSGNSLSVAFFVLIALSLISGVAHATGIALMFGPVTSMQLHVGSAVLAGPLAIWHVRARPVRLHRTDLTRRNVLKFGMLAGASAAAYVGVEAVTRLARLPGRRRRGTGSYESGSHSPHNMPVTQWLDDRVPSIDPDGWTLRVGDTVWTYDELRSFDDHILTILDCTGGWWAEQEWAGARLDRLVTPSAGTRSVVVTSATGYARRFPIRDVSRLLLATRVEGEALSAGHGFPARLVAPGRRGFWWVKWVVRIDISDQPWWLQSPFPLT